MAIKQYITLNNRLTELAVLASAVGQFADQAELDKQVAFHVNLVLDELVTNIINYAYDDTDLHHIEITLSYNAPVFSATLIDDGKAFDPTMIVTPDLSSSLEQRNMGGLGVHFVKTLMDKIDYNRHANNNYVRIEKHLS